MGGKELETSVFETGLGVGKLCPYTWVGMVF